MTSKYERKKEKKEKLQKLSVSRVHWSRIGLQLDSIVIGICIHATNENSIVTCN